MIELYTGKPPYADLIPMATLFRIVENDCPPLPENASEVNIHIAQDKKQKTKTRLYI